MKLDLIACEPHLEAFLAFALQHVAQLVSISPLVDAPGFMGAFAHGASDQVAIGSVTIAPMVVVGDALADDLAANFLRIEVLKGKVSGSCSAYRDHDCRYRHERRDLSTTSSAQDEETPKIHPLLLEHAAEL